MLSSKHCYSLAAGSVIHAVHTQNIEEMGGLWKKLRLTGPLFLIGTLAISGVPFFSGFFSKDEILVAAWEGGHPDSILVSSYRGIHDSILYVPLVLHGIYRRAQEEVKNVHESPAIMTYPDDCPWRCWPSLLVM